MSREISTAAPTHEKPYDNCSVVGVYSHSTDVVDTAYQGLVESNHRGQEGSGIVVGSKSRFAIQKDSGLAEIVFGVKHSLPRVKRAYVAIGHNRYSTSGSIAETQPFLEDGIAIAHNGNLTNITTLREKYNLPETIEGASSDTRMALAVINRMEGDEIHRIVTALPQFEGAYSFVFATKKGLVAARDPKGFRPLSLGKLKGGDGYVVASETSAFNSMGAEFVRDVMPGETLLISKEGLQTLALHKESQLAQCIFELIYIARPDSVVFGIPVMEFRKRQGAILARHLPPNIDVIMPVPRSGISASLGVAADHVSRGSTIEYSEGLYTNPYRGKRDGPRTFIRPSDRRIAATKKYSVIESEVRGKRIALVDDSIVRGSIEIIVQKLRDAGAIEVHLLVASPPLKHACYMGVDFGDNELIANQYPNQEERARKLGLDSLYHLSYAELMEAALGNPVSKRIQNPATLFEEHGYCGACFTGRYPISIEGVIKKIS